MDEKKLFKGGRAKILFFDLILLNLEVLPVLCYIYVNGFVFTLMEIVMRLFLPVLFFTFFSHSIFAENLPKQLQPSVDVAKELTALIDAKAIKRVAPKFPIDEAREGRDGWVRLSFIIEPDGTTSSPIIESSSGSKNFEKEALRAVKKWKFEPATENGEKVQQCNNSVQMDFKMNRDKAGVSKKFKRLYSKFAKVLDENNNAEIEKYAQRIKNYKMYTSFETYYQYSILAEYHRYKGDKSSELAALNRALGSMGSSGLFARLANEKNVSAEGVKLSVGEKRENKVAKSIKKSDALTAKLLPPILHQKLMIELDFGQISNALDTTNKLLLLSKGTKREAPYSKQKQALESLVNSDKHITTRAEVGDGLLWHYRLLRNEFSFADIKGHLLSLDVRCKNKRHLYTINNQSKWRIPESWQDCSLYIKGERGSQFTLIEYPNLSGDLASLN